MQIGFGRAGWYSCDLVDNLGRPSATRILPEFQQIEVGAASLVYAAGRRS